VPKKVGVNQIIKILFLASEADPFIKVGGLGDVAGSLPLALSSIPQSLLAGASLDIRLVIPFHRAIDRTCWKPEKVANFFINKGNHKQKVECFFLTHNGLRVFLIFGKPIKDCEKVYSLNTVEDGEKFTFFSLAALELCRVLDWAPNILHVNDWHTALAVHQLSSLRKTDPFFSQTRSVITLHNLPFMGGGTEPALAAYGICPSKHPSLPGWARFFPLPMGLAAADQIVAVSRSYASEIMTPEFGCGLENFLSTRASIISGILNGLDEETWNPETDPQLPRRYNAASLPDRNINKSALLKEMGLVEQNDTPLITLISRMDRQKGIALALDTLRLSTGLPWQAVILGSGDPDLESAALQLEIDMPDRVRVVTKFDSALSHCLYGAADILFMPSLYEPCGLSQMIGMRYGCLPVARAVGGLKDTIKHRRTGFLFNAITPVAARKTLKLAFRLFQDKPLWHNMQVKAMSMDFSWRYSAKKYADLYMELENENEI
jgi:starch synthase